jgi:hypothetical protein
LYADIRTRHAAQRVLVSRCERDALGRAKGKLPKAAGNVVLKPLPETRVSIQSIEKSP